MARIKRGRFRKGKGFLDDDVNPMEGAVNIVDAMLVFACGLMLSLVIFWNVDLRSNDMLPVTQGSAMNDSESVNSTANSTEAGDDFEEVGKVYKDPKTGKLYLAEPKSE
jgi:hypothetical protein